MPLSAPAARRHLHTRTIECRGYHRDDGLWDIEAHLVDTKTYSFENRWRGTVEPGTPVHEMRLRLTIDEDMRVHRAEAATDNAPFSICGDVAPAYAAIEGLRIGPGWNARVRELLGGTRGCTHLVELLGPLATVAYQTLVGRRRRDGAEAAAGAGRRPRIVDSCHAWSSDGPVVRDELPEFYTGS